MILTYPTTPTAYTVQRWGNVNYSMYPGGRHMGIDIGGPMVGAPIYAVCDGVVKEVNLVGAHGYGRHVIINGRRYMDLLPVPVVDSEPETPVVVIPTPTSSKMRLVVIIENGKASVESCEVL